MDKMGNTKNKKVIGISVLVITIVLSSITFLYFGLIQQSGYDNQCNLDSCPSGFSESDTSCDDDDLECTRICESDMETGCSDDYDFNNVITRTKTIDVNLDPNEDRYDQFESPSYTANDNYCYKFTGEVKLKNIAWGGAGSAQVIAMVGEGGTPYFEEIETECGQDGDSSVTATTDTYEMGRGNGDSLVARGSGSDFDNSGCSGAGPINNVDAEMVLTLIIEQSDYVSSSDIPDDVELTCDFGCDGDSDCGDDEEVGSDICFNGDVYVDYQTWDCSDYSCSSDIEPKLVEDCGSLGCSNGVCNTQQQCTPKTCSELGKTCGNWDDECGTVINCGTCQTDICDSTHLDLCTTSSDCDSASGYWYNDTCNENEQTSLECTGSETKCVSENYYECENNAFVD